MMSRVYVSPVRIAFGHRARVGKDEAALTYKKYLMSKYNHDTVLKSFSRPIYDIMYETQDRLGISKEKDREFLQFVGEWAKQHNPEVWLNCMSREIAWCQDLSIIVTDLRFKNEADLLKNLGFKLIRIDNPTVPVMDHPSEHDLDTYGKWDAVIYNNCSLDEFRQRVIDTVNVCMPPTQYEEEQNNERWRWCSNLPEI